LLTSGEQDDKLVVTFKKHWRKAEIGNCAESLGKCWDPDRGTNSNSFL